MRTTPKRITLAVLVAVAALLALYTLAGFVLVPYVVERELPRYARDTLQRNAAITGVAFNPFLLTLRARDVRLTERNGDPILEVDRVVIDLQWSSLVRPGWRFDRVHLDGMDLRVALQPDGRLNLAELADRGDRPSRQRDDAITLPQVLVRNAAVRHGTVRFSDLSSQTPASTALRWVDLRLNDLTTLTDEQGHCVLTALLAEGGALAWRASFTLRPIASKGQLRLLGLSPVTAWKFVQDEVRLAQPEGTIDFSAAYRFAWRNGKPALALDGMQLVASNLVLREAGEEGSPVLALQTLEARDGRFDLDARELVLPSVALREGSARVAVSPEGTFNWQRVLDRDQADAPAGGQPWRIALEALNIESVALRYDDASRLRPLAMRVDALDASMRVAVTAGAGPAQVSAEDIRLNGHGLAVHHQGDMRTPVLAAKAISAQNGRFDLAGRALSVPGLRLQNGTLVVAVGPDGTLNWQALLAQRDTPADPVTADAAPWRIGLPGLRLEALALRYVDRSRVRPMALDIRSLTAGGDVAIAAGEAPMVAENLRLRALDAALRQADTADPAALTLKRIETDGGHIAGREVFLPGLRLREGRLVYTVSAAGSSNWEQYLAQRGTPRAGDDDARPWRFNLPGAQVDRVDLQYVDHSRVRPLAMEVSGLAAGLALRASTGGPTTRLDAENIRLSAASLEVKEAGAPFPALRLESIGVSNARLSGRELTLPGLALGTGRVLLAVDRDGHLNWQRLFEARVAGDRDAGTATPGEPWRIRSPGLRITDIALRYVDRQRSIPLALDASQVAVRLDLDVTAGGTRTRVAADKASISAHRLALSELGRDDPLATLRSVALTGGELDTAARRAAARTVALTGGSSALIRDEKGEIPLLQALAADGAQTPVPRQAGAPASPRPWTYRVRALRLADVDLAIADLGTAPALRYDVRLASGFVSGLDSAGPPAPFQADVRAKQGGRLDLSGTIAPDGSRADARLRLSEFHAVPLQPLLARYASLTLRSGTLSAAAQVRYRGGAQRASLHADGALQIADLRLDEGGTDQRFLSWKTMSAEPVVFDLTPARLAIGEILVNGPTGKLEISKDGELNVLQVLRQARGEAQPRSATAQGNSVTAQANSATAQADSATAPPPDGAQPARFDVRVDRVRVREGALHFADQSLVLPFVADVSELNGSMVNLSNRPRQRAELRAEGRIDPFGLAQARGTIELASPRDFTDIRAEFSNVRMRPLTPYAINFAGHEIASGTLWLDLNYRIVDANLVGENEVTMQDLVIGERVDPLRAGDIPLELAVALLRDERGRLSVRVPIRGDLDDPQFDYRTVIRSAITNTLRRVVTAPLRFVGRLFGRPEELDNIEFEPGSDLLRPPEQEKLNAVAESLKERPRYELLVRAAYAPLRDAQALRTERVRRALAQAMGMDLLPAEHPGPIAYNQAATQLALEAMLRARAGPGAVAALQREVEQARGRPARRVDPRQRRLGEGSDDVELYRAMFQRLVELEPLPEDAPRQLAQRRTESIVDYLARSPEVDAQRIAAAEARALRRSDADSIPAELSLRSARDRS